MQDRASEKLKIREIIDAAKGTRLSAQLILGEAGIGKTTILNAVLDDLPEGTLTILCLTDEADFGVPYTFFAELSHRLRLAPEIDNAFADELDEIFVGITGGEPGDYVYQLAGWLRRLIESTDVELLVIACEDIHNLDSESIRLLTPLIRTLRNVPIAMLFTSRRGFESQTYELQRLLARMSDYGAGTSIELESLNAADLVSLAASQPGPKLDRKRLDELINATAGNPFLVEQYLSVASAQSLRSASIEPDFELRPVSQQTELLGANVILMRFFPKADDRLALAQLLSLFLGAVRHGNPAVEQVRDIYGLAHNQLTDAWDGLVAAGVLRPGSDQGSYSFIHPLVREALYESIGVGRRAISHRLIAESLSAANPSDQGVFEIATHYYLSGAIDAADTPAADASLRAASIAEDSASSVAALWLRRSLELLPEHDGRRVWTYLSLIHALLAIWATREAMEAARAAEAEFRGRPEAEFVALTAAIAYLLSGHPELAIDALKMIDVSELDPSTRFWATAYRPMVLLQLDRPAAALEAFADCTTPALVREAGGEIADALSDATLAGYALMTGRAQDYEVHFRRCLAVIPEVPRPNRREIVATLSYLDMSGPGRSAEVSKLLAATYERPLEDDELGMLGPASAAAWTLIHWLRGDLPLAQRVTHLAAQQTEVSGAIMLLASQQAIDIVLCVELGSIREARVTAESMVPGQPGNHGYVSLARSRLAEVDGDFAAARAILEDYLEEARTKGLMVCVAAAADELVRLYLANDQPGHAKQIAEQTYARVSPLDWPLQTMFAIRARGRANGDAQDVLAAARICEELGLAFEALNCELALAGLGDDPEARLLRALAGYRELGAVRSEQLAKDELKRQGFAVPRRSRAASQTSAELTEVEREVSQLVVQGLSNRQIASAVFVSVKTVELYLSRIYAKEGVRSRVQLAAKLLGAQEKTA